MISIATCGCVISDIVENPWAICAWCHMRNLNDIMDQYKKINVNVLLNGLVVLFFPLFQVVSNMCNPNPCQQGVQCHIIEGRHMCVCPDGYYGDECTSLKSPCVGHHCPGERNTWIYKSTKSSWFLLWSRCLRIWRPHVWFDTRRPQLLHDSGGSLSSADGLWLCRLRLHPVPPPSEAEKAAGCPTGRRHQQPEGVCQPHQKRGPSSAPAARRCPSYKRASPCPCLTLLRGDWTDPAALPGPFTPLPGTKAFTCCQNGHFKPGKGEAQSPPLCR